ncbi:MAG: aldo/keto reductase [Pseudomonadota bacterium]
MEMRKIGDREVSVLGVGGMSFSDFYGATDEAESHAVLDAAVAAGVTHIDTANVYGMGKSESAIGSWLASRGGRDGLFIATKAGIARGIGAAAGNFDNSADYLEAELDGSLKRLGVDHVDLFYIHRRDQSIPIEEVTATLARLVEKGKTRAFGYSEISPASLRRAAAVAPVAAVQSEYSLQTRVPELGLLQTCAELGTMLVAFSPVGRGLLTDLPPTAEKYADSQPWMAANPRFVEPNLSANVAATEPLRELARSLGISTAALALRWVYDQAEHIVAIPGTRSVDRFAEYLSAETVPEAAMEEVARLLPPGWAHGDRYSHAQWNGPENYC